MTPYTVAHDEDVQAAGSSTAGPSTPGPSTPGPSTAGPWQDIDAELTCSAREVWVGFGGPVPAEVLAVLRGSARPWADGRRCGP